MWRAIIALLLFFLNQVLALAILLVYECQTSDNGSPGLGNIQSILHHLNPVHYGTVLLFTTLFLIGMLLLTRLTGKGVLKSFMQGMPKGWLWGIGAFFAISIGLSGILSPFDLDNAGVSAMFSGMQHSFPCALLIIIAGPMAEELVFRDSIIRILLPTGRWTAIIVSAFAFAVIHGNLMQGIPAFVMGIALALLYLHTGDLRLCLPAHILNNTLGYLEICFPETAECTAQWPSSVLSVTGTLLFAGGLWMLHKLQRSSTHLQQDIA